MTDNRDAHMKGVLRLIDPYHKARAARLIKTEKGRGKFLKELCHNIEMHPDYAVEPPRGERSNDKLLARLKSLGAGSRCYVIASDDPEHDDTFQTVEEMLGEAWDYFGHGTILSCKPGKLALVRTAWPHRNLIVHRPG